MPLSSLILIVSDFCGVSSVNSDDGPLIAFSKSAMRDCGSSLGKTVLSLHSFKGALVLRTFNENNGFLSNPSFFNKLVFLFSHFNPCVDGY